MNLHPQIRPASRGKLVASLLSGVLLGGAAVTAVQSWALKGPHQTAAVVTLIHPAEAKAAPTLTPEEPTQEAEERPTGSLQLTERERVVIARLASLPDLPIVRAPAFDLQSAPVKTTAKSSPTPAKSDQSATSPAPPAGESVIARIQVVSVEKGRVFYRSVDDEMHTARTGERLLGVNGKVLAIDDQGAELLIDGQRMRVTANNM